MKRDIGALSSGHYDVIVVGGGIFGACAAWEAAFRGLSVALMERGDFSQATSANHLKMIHGGIRYLQHVDLKRVRESSSERSAFLRIAPHLARPLPIIVPTYGHGIKGREFLGAGFLAYDVLTADRNRHIPDPARRIPRGRFMSREEALKQFPGLKKDGLTGAGVFSDGQMYNPPRIALSFIQSAVNKGAVVANYVEAVNLLQSGSTIVGVEAKDVLTGDRFEVRGSVVLNAAGPWADRLLKQTLGISLDPQPTFSRDLAFICTRSVNRDYGFACQTRTADADAIFERGGRHLFIVPWRDRTLIGVWHVVYEGDPDKITASEQELEGFINEVNDAYPSFNLNPDDISLVLTGLTLFGEKDDQGVARISFGKRSLLIDHARSDNIDGLITLIGVRATEGRSLPRKALDLVFKKLGKKSPVSKTDKTPIHGGDMECFDDIVAQLINDPPFDLQEGVLRALVHNYGTQYPRVLEYAAGNPRLAETLERSTVLKAEVVHAVRDEMAHRLSDVVLRRTDLGTAGPPAERALQECAELTGAELGWNAPRTQAELGEMKTVFSQKSRFKNYAPADNTNRNTHS